MKLNVGTSSGFVVTGKRIDLYKVAGAPGARLISKDQTVRLPWHITSWKTLKDIDFEFISTSARNKMKELGDEYYESRRKLRMAERRFKKAKLKKIPVPLKTTPYEHQVRAFGFSSTMDHSALFMDQGTGKSMVTVAIAGQRFLRGEVKRLLVICPKAVKPVWPREFNKHAEFPFSFGIDNPPDDNDGIQVWVTNYDRVKREMRRLKKWAPDMVVLDESHRIKNRKADRTKACIQIGQYAKYRMVLSGTPFAKCISEVWSQFRFLNDTVFGRSFSTFKNRYLKMGGYMQYEVVGYQNEEEFSRKMHEHAFRVKKGECLDLPELNYQNLFVTPDKATRDAYNELEKELFIELEGEDVTASSAAVLSMKLRQVVGGAVNSDNNVMTHVSSLKMSTLGDYLEDRRGKKTIVFFCFTNEIVEAQRMAQKMKMRYITLQGSTKEADKATFEDRFQKGDEELAFINIQCGAEGMTLTAADNVVFFSPTFSYIGYSQARDRAYRIGQDKKVTIIFIIMEKTIDERVANILECNGQLVDSYLNDNRNYFIRNPKMANATTYTPKDICEELGITAQEARLHLRNSGIEKPAEGWKWTKKSDLNAAIKAVKERMALLADKKTAKAPGKTGSGKPAKVNKVDKAGKTPDKASKEESGDDFDSMDKDALLAYAEANDIKVPAAKKRSIKGLRTFVAENASKK